MIRRVSWDTPDDEPDTDPDQEQAEEMPRQEPAIVAPVQPTEETQRLRLPLGGPINADNVQLARHQDRISLTVRDAPLSAVLGLIAEQHGLNIVASDDTDQRISVTMSDVRLEDALDSILSVNGFAWTKQKDILVVSRVTAETKGFPSVQGRSVRVYPLNYVSAQDVDKVVKGLLSPVGQSFIIQASATDQRRTTEQLVVEDLPEYLARVDAYIGETDRRPRQVMVEAHVLQVTLKDDTSHGVNFNQLLKVAGSNVNIGTAGFASATASPAGLLTVSGHDLNTVIECLQVTTDAKTLASPKVAVLNGQEAHIQIGGKLGYLLTTTVQTTSMQSVNFLDFGVILKVTPVITAENKVLLNVKPQVSSARLNPANNLPESETTELETKVMLESGQAVVIGGLIKETNNDVQNKIPHLGNMWGIGRLFQRRLRSKERDEIIITLLPTIVPDDDDCLPGASDEAEQAHTPLMFGPLNCVDRTEWEPKLPDASQPPRVKKFIKSGVRYLPGPQGVQPSYAPDHFPAEPPPGDSTWDNRQPIPLQPMKPENIPPGIEELPRPRPGVRTSPLPPGNSLPEMDDGMTPMDEAMPDQESKRKAPSAPLRLGQWIEKPNAKSPVKRVSFSPRKQTASQTRNPHAP